VTATEWTYLTYSLMAAGALGLFFALPRGGRTQKAAALLFGAIAAGGVLLILGAALGNETQSSVTFYVLALVAIAAAVRVITHRTPVYSALYFTLVVVATAGLAIMAGAQFLGAALVIVYAGAILVTYVFVIMLAQQTPGVGETFATTDYDNNAREPGTAVLAGFVLVATLTGPLIGRRWPETVPTPSDVSNTMAVGHELLTRYAVAVELAGVLLMVAMIGALAIARKHVPGDLLPSRPPSSPPGEIGKTVKPF
jgi:NADH-quinone oxidoreductase subunit J